MWIFFNDAYLSIVTDKADPNNYMVRARFVKDIERVFPDAIVTETLSRDYRFRASIPIDTVTKAIANRVANINYNNFKDSTTTNLRHDIYLEVWAILERWQEKLLPAKQKAKQNKRFLDAWQHYLDARYGPAE